MNIIITENYYNKFVELVEEIEDKADGYEDAVLKSKINYLAGFLEGIKPDEEELKK